MPGAAQLVDRARDVAAAVDAAERLQVLLVEALRAERHAIDAGVAIAAKRPCSIVPGIGFERDLDVAARTPTRARTPSRKRPISRA